MLRDALLRALAFIFRRNLSELLFMPKKYSPQLVKSILHAIFFLSGIATVLIGQVLPIFARHFSLSDLQVSYFFPAQFAGSLIGTYVTSWFARRNNYMAAAMIGGFAMASGARLM